MSVEIHGTRVLLIAKDCVEHLLVGEGIDVELSPSI